MGGIHGQNPHSQKPKYVWRKKRMPDGSIKWVLDLPDWYERELQSKWTSDHIIDPAIDRLMEANKRFTRSFFSFTRFLGRAFWDYVEQKPKGADTRITPPSASLPPPASSPPPPLHLASPRPSNFSQKVGRFFSSIGDFIDRVEYKLLGPPDNPAWAWRALALIFLVPLSFLLLGMVLLWLYYAIEFLIEGWRMILGI
jgi:hypothetical protein